jgi:hypothetical protein
MKEGEKEEKRREEKRREEKRREEKRREEKRREEKRRKEKIVRLPLQAPHLRCSPSLVAVMILNSFSSYTSPFASAFFPSAFDASDIWLHIIKQCNKKR